MSAGQDLETLAARFAAMDAVTAYAVALDSRDWTGFRALFEDEIDIDYSSLGSISGVIAAQTWVDRCKVLGGFDATLHKVTNFRVKVAGHRAEVSSYVDAAHFIGDKTGVACGAYLHRLNRHPTGWRIAACTFRLAGCPGGRAAFDEAFAAARAAYAAQA